MNMQANSTETRGGGSLQPDCSARPLVVTQDLVNDIIQRAKDSRWGLDDAKCETSLAHYADEDAHTLAMILVNGWEAKYDLVSLFAAAIEVVHEKAQNAKLTDRPSQ